MNIDLGRVTPIYRGAYNAAVSYELNDIVLHTDGNLYWHVSPVSTTGVAPTDTSAWVLAFSGVDVTAAIEQIKEDAEAIALGTRGGVPVGNSDPYYHNNAAWYASQASASATAAGNAQTAAETAQGAAEAARDKAAQWATGGTTGTPGAENNAKYFSEQAAGSAAAAAASAAAAAANTALAEAFDATKQYVPGDLCVYSGGLYVFTADHLGAWDASDVEATTIEEQLQAARDLALGAYPTETSSGAVATTEAGADNLPPVLVEIDVNAEKAGSGEPSWTNERDISGRSIVTLYQSGADLSDPTIRAISLGFTSYGGKLQIFGDGSGKYLRTFGYAYVGSDGTLVTPEAEVTTHTWQGQISNQPRVYSGLGEAVVTGGAARFCSCYPNNTIAVNDTTNGFNISDSGTTHRCYFRDTSVPGWSSAETADELAEAWTSYLASQYAAGKHLEIIYPLNTPVETTLSAVQVLSVLGVNNLWADSGDVRVIWRLDPTLALDQLRSAILALGNNT